MRRYTFSEMLFSSFITNTLLYVPSFNLQSSYGDAFFYFQKNLPVRLFSSHTCCNSYSFTEASSRYSKFFISGLFRATKHTSCTFQEAQQLHFHHFYGVCCPLSYFIYTWVVVFCLITASVEEILCNCKQKNSVIGHNRKTILQINE